MLKFVTVVTEFERGLDFEFSSFRLFGSLPTLAKPVLPIFPIKYWTPMNAVLLISFNRFIKYKVCQTAPAAAVAEVVEAARFLTTFLT